MTVNIPDIKGIYQEGTINYNELNVKAQCLSPNEFNDLASQSKEDDSKQFTW